MGRFSKLPHSVNNAQFALSAMAHQDRTYELIYDAPKSLVYNLLDYTWFFLSSKLQAFGLWREPDQSLLQYFTPCLELFS